MTLINNKNIGQTASKIRFRRWSRKPYAVFMGLNKNISIGTLSKRIVDTLLPKTNTLEIIVPAGTHLSLQDISMDEVLSHEANISITLTTACI
ncbi:MAG: hypothetical protein RSC28_05100 [Bacteroidales bacterium]